MTVLQKIIADLKIDNDPGGAIPLIEKYLPDEEQQIRDTWNSGRINGSGRPGDITLDQYLLTLKSSQ